MGVRIGVDVGGTFTDIVCFNDQDGMIQQLKLSSTPDEPERAVIEGTSRLLSRLGLSPEQVEFFIHGTTVATNAVLERKGARVALLVTEGFRDVLQVMRQDRPRLYDYFEARPEPLVPRRDRYEVSERVLHTGAVERLLNEEALRSLLRKIYKEGIRDFAVCLLHSYLNPEHERQVLRVIQEELPEARVSLSSEILPEIKEFERMSTTAVNAYVLPEVGEYLRRLGDGLSALKIKSQLHLMRANGGIMTARTAESHSVHTVLSGPAAGALSALVLARQAKVDNMISIDVGGTSADVAVAFEGRLNFAEENEVGGLVIKAPSIEIETVGAGGGSIGWIDAGGVLQVGPRSAGAQPGPVCYGRGGGEPTVTDAHLVLGRLSPDNFLGGEMKISSERARAAILDSIARPLGLEVNEAAEGMIRVINAVMAKSIRRLSVEKGYDPREFTLVALGGAGPMHAADLAVELQIPRVLIPPAPGVSSAQGLLTADFRHDYVKTLLCTTEDLEIERFRAVCDLLVHSALEQMEREGVRRAQVGFQPQVDMRYRGQGFSLPVFFVLEELETWCDLDPLVDRFHQHHQSVYAYSDRREPTEIVNIRLAAIGELTRPQFKRLDKRGNDASGAIRDSRSVYIQKQTYTVSVYDRSQLAAGNRITGPCIVEQLDSTTILLPGMEGRIDSFGNLLLTMENF